MEYELGQAVVMLAASAGEKTAAAPTTSYGLKGRLVKSDSGWILLEVPNALGRGAFDALNEPGAELPTSRMTTGEERYKAHISVIRPEELEQIEGGADAITERGQMFSYTLGPVRTVNPSGWGEMSKVWYIEVRSPELKALRKSYGLPPLPKDDQFEFHITFAVRKKNVLGRNATRKAASLLYGDYDAATGKRDGVSQPGVLGDRRTSRPASEAGRPDGHLQRPASGDDDRDPPGQQDPVEGSNPPVGGERPTPDPLTQLRAAKAASDAGNYAQKHAIMRGLIQASPGDFIIDSRLGRVVGVTHQPTGFRMHLPAKVLPQQVKSADWRDTLNQVLQNKHVRRGLIGGGIGGVAGLLASIDDPDLDALGGFGLGALAGGGVGVGGGVLGDVLAKKIRQLQQPRLPDVPKEVSEMSLADVIEDYYKDAPGGLDEAIARAQKHIPGGKPYGLQEWDPESVRRKVPLTRYDAESFKLPSGQEVGGFAEIASGSDPIPVHVADPGLGLGERTKMIREHELSHAGLQPSNRSLKHVMQAVGQPTVPYDRRYGKEIQLPPSQGSQTVLPGMDRGNWDYATLPDELKAFVSPIKREWVKATGRHLDTPAAAQEAIQWWLKQPTKFHQRHHPFSTQLPQRLQQTPHGRRVLQQQLLQTVMGGVDPKQLGKVAADSHYLQAARTHGKQLLSGQVPIYNPAQTPVQNFTSHLAAVKGRGDKSIQQAANWDRMQNAMDPNRATRRLMSFVQGRQPLVSHPVDRAVQGDLRL